MATFNLRKGTVRCKKEERKLPPGDMRAYIVALMRGQRVVM